MLKKVLNFNFKRVLLVEPALTLLLNIQEELLILVLHPAHRVIGTMLTHALFVLPHVLIAILVFLNVKKNKINFKSFISLHFLRNWILVFYWNLHNLYFPMCYLRYLYFLNIKKNIKFFILS